MTDYFYNLYLCIAIANQDLNSLPISYKLQQLLHRFTNIKDIAENEWKRGIVKSYFFRVYYIYY